MIRPGSAAKEGTGMIFSPMQTMSNKITPMTHGQGFSANLVTAFLVIIASKMGVPVSTTHVSCGSIFGIGLASKQGRWNVVGGDCGRLGIDASSRGPKRSDSLLDI